jgi:hypothetical protein
VAHAGEPGRRRAADPLRRRVGAHELRVGALEGDELREQAIVLAVADRRRGEHVVVAVVDRDLADQRRMARDELPLLPHDRSIRQQRRRFRAKTNGARRSTATLGGGTEPACC